MLCGDWRVREVRRRESVVKCCDVSIYWWPEYVVYCFDCCGWLFMQ